MCTDLQIVGSNNALFKRVLIQWIQRSKREALQNPNLRIRREQQSGKIYWKVRNLPQNNHFSTRNDTFNFALLHSNHN